MMHLFIFLLGLSVFPCFRAGYFWEGEVTTILLYLTLPIVCFFYKPKTLDLLSKTYLYFFINALIFTPFCLNFSSHILGTPQTNYGVLYLLFMAIGFAFIEDCPKNLFYSTFAFVALFSLINVLSHPQYGFSYLDNWYPFNFTAIFGAIALVPLGLLIKYPYKFKIVSIVTLSILIVLSRNKTLTVALCILGPLFYIIRNIKKWQALTFIICLPFLVIGLEAAAYYFQIESLGTLTSRFLTLKVLNEAIIESPYRIITGFGFGNSGELMEAFLTKVPVSLYQKQAYNPTWDALDRIEFDSYHALVEAFISMGVLGALFQMMIWVLPILKASSENIRTTTFLLSLWILHKCTWFTLPIQWVFDLLFFRLLLPNNRSK